MNKPVGFILMASPALAFLIRAWLWVFGILQPLSETQACAGAVMAIINFLIAGFVCDILLL